MLARSNPEVARELLHLAQEDVHRQWGVYSNRAAMPGNAETPGHAAPDLHASTPQPVTAGGKK
jgi:pyruvate-ferredoxin/flavodoxin oxidoreductase